MDENTGQPPDRKNESGRLLKLESTLHKRVVGQDEAVTAVAKAIKRGRVGLKDRNVQSVLSCSLVRTGVGKTELSKALAETVFGSEDAMIRVDMSEYMEKNIVFQKLVFLANFCGYLHLWRRCRRRKNLRTAVRAASVHGQSGLQRNYLPT